MGFIIFIAVVVCIVILIVKAVKTAKATKAANDAREFTAKEAKEAKAELEARADSGDADAAKELLVRKQSSEELYNRGLSYLRSEDYNKAIADFIESIRLDPDNYPALSYLASAYNNLSADMAKQKNYKEAINDLDKAIVGHTEYLKHDPDSTKKWLASAHDNRGMVYYNKGNYGKAIADHTKSLELDSNNPQVYNNRGDAYTKKGNKYYEAVDDYVKSFKLDQNPVALKRLAKLFHIYEYPDYAHLRENLAEKLGLDPDYLAALLSSL